jgi:uncharacterized protein (TIGR02266 family)
MQLNLKVQVRFPSADALLRSSTFDISPGGAFIPTTARRPIGTGVELYLTVADRAMRLPGRIANIVNEGRRGVGVQFLSLDPGDERFLRELVASKPAL